MTHAWDPHTYLLRAAHPDGPAGVVLPFRRVFVVARRLPER